MAHPRKRNIIIALTVTAAVAIALSVRTNDAPRIETSNSKEEANSISRRPSIVDIANEAPVKEAPAGGIKDISSMPIEEELADNDEPVDADSDNALSMESQDFVRTVAYEAVASPDVSSVAYLEKIECDNFGCDVAFRFYDTGRISRKASSLMESMNARLEENPSTKNLQFGFTLLKIGDDGIGVFDLVTMPKQEQTFVTIIKDGSLSDEYE